MNTTKEGIEVRPGQTWRDLDYRVQRTVKVERVVDGFAHVVSSTGAKSRIRINRMHKHSQGFQLLREV